MFFLQPLWLWASAVLLVPVAIHLWNLSKGKVLRIGSTAFIPESSRRSSRRIKLSQWILLVLRCLLLVLLSILLAQPRSRETMNEKGESGWILADAEFGNADFAPYRKFVDSLIRAGFVCKTWDTSLATISYPDWKEKLSENRSEDIWKPWHLVQELNRRQTNDFPIYIFANNSLRDYNGIRPNSTKGLQWISYNKKDTLIQRIAKAWLTDSDSVMVIVNESEHSGTRLISRRISMIQPEEGFSVNRNTEGIFVSLNGQHPIVADSGRILITIVCGTGERDAEYLESALQAIKKVTGLALSIQKIKPDDPVPSDQDWIFWLSETDMPPSTQAKNIFRYTSGKVEQIRSRMLNARFSATQQEPIQLSQVRQPPVNRSGFGSVYWTDGYGRPLLYETTGIKPVHFFNSRLLPEWNGLVWNENFPRWIFSLLIKDIVLISDPSAEARMIDGSQTKPLQAEEKRISVADLPRWKDISDWIWLILLALFFTERILSTKKTRRL